MYLLIRSQPVSKAFSVGCCVQGYMLDNGSLSRRSKRELEKDRGISAFRTEKTNLCDRPVTLGGASTL